MSEELNVLLVDDDADDQLFVLEAVKDPKAIGLEDVSMRVSTVRNGSEALDYLLNVGAFADEKTPDFIILDLNMPVMNGVTFLQTLKAIREFKNIPVYVLTTSDDPRQHEFCKQMGACNCFTKPFRISQLQEIISEMILLKDYCV